MLMDHALYSRHPIADLPGGWIPSHEPVLVSPDHRVGLPGLDSFTFLVGTPHWKRIDTFVRTISFGRLVRLDRVADRLGERPLVMETGGLVGESKMDVLCHLQESFPNFTSQS